MSKKTKSSSQSTSTSTSTPTNPEWVTSGVRALSDRTLDLLGRDPKSFVAGPSALQKKAFADAGNLSLSEDYGRARSIFNDVANAGANTYDPTDATSQGYDNVDWTGEGYNANTYSASSLLDGLDRYMSPYTGQVVDAALADYDYGAGQTRANQALDEARSGAFGGSGAAITRSMTEGDLARGRAATSANLRDQAFGRGAALSATDAGFRNDASRFNAGAMNEASAFGANARNTSAAANAAARNSALAFGADAANRTNLANAAARNDAGRYNAGAMDTALARRLSAGGALVNLGSTMGADTRANLELQGKMGADQRAIDQALAAADLNVLNDLAGIYGGLPLNLFTGNTTTGTNTSSGTTKTYDPWGTYISWMNATGSNASRAATGGG
jgi:hypothetical protein